MYVHTRKHTHIFHNMWISQTSTRYVWETEPGILDEYAFSAH